MERKAAEVSVMNIYRLSGVGNKEKRKTLGSAVSHNPFRPVPHNPWVLLNLRQRYALLRVVPEKLEHE
jgi:hypothetical protein